MDELIAQYLPIAILLVGILAFVVSVIVEVIKNIPGIKKIPTDLIVIILSVALTIGAMFAYLSYTAMVVTWWMVIAGVLGGFFVAFIAMFGWEKLNELWARFKRK